MNVRFIENDDMSAVRDWCVTSIINFPPKPLRFYFVSASSLNFGTNEDA